MIGTLAPVAAAAFLLVACGGDDGDGAALDGASSESGATATTGLRVEAHDIDFDSDAYRVAAGQVDVEYVQEGQLPHSLVVEASDGGGVDDFRLEVGDADADSGTVDLPAGDYVIWCDIPGHRDAGMEADVRAE